MEYIHVLNQLQRQQGFSPVKAEQAVATFMETLSAKLSASQFEAVSQLLPQPMVSLAAPEGQTTKLGRHVFLERIATSSFINQAEVRTQSRAVWRALNELMPEADLAELRSHLPTALSQDLTG